ncbi:MAG: geranylgeranyl diphosphate reductase [Chloroherpetonaceae bacterium]|nr:geranylgeranyl diphosphate reductase [Chloroherpetonaceae bacterium]
MNADVAVVGGGPAGASAANELAQKGISVVLIERDLNNAKPCGGAIPLGLIEEFEIPDFLVERKVTRMAVRSPSGRIVEMTMPRGFVGMVRRERFDKFLRERAARNGATLLEGKFRTVKETSDGYALSVETKDGGTLDVRARYVIGADGANSKVALDLGFPPNEFKAVAIQQRFRSCPELARYENLVEIWYDGEVSPDFYAWVFPKADHIAIGTGVEDGKANVKKLQARFIEKLGVKIKPYYEEAAKIPMHPRKTFVKGNAMLAGDAAGLVTPSNGEGIFFAMKSGKMAAETLVDHLKGKGSPLALYEKNFRKRYDVIFKGLGAMQWLYYRNDRLRESFVSILEDEHVQQISFDSYLYKKMVPAPFWVQLKIAAKNLYHLAIGK